MNFPSFTGANITQFGKGYNGASTAYFMATSAVPSLLGGQFSSGTTHSSNIVFAAAGWTTNTWHHAYFEYDTGTTKWASWFDGTFVVLSGATVGPVQTGKKFYIGGLDVNGTPGQLATVSLCDVTVFNGPLQQTEIFNLGKGLIRPNTAMSRTILGYWPLNGGSPEPDLSGNLNTGAVNGTPAVVADPLFPGPSRRGSSLILPWSAA